MADIVVIPVSYELVEPFAEAAHREGGRIREEAEHFGVLLDGELVGCGAVRPGRNGVAIISGAYVLPEYRRRGLATALIEAREQHARAQGYREIRSVVVNLWLDAWLRRGYTIRRRYKLGAEVSLDIAPTGLSFDQVAEILGRQRWIFAKTMPDNPHWYTRRNDWADAALFPQVVAYMRHHGYTESWPAGKPWAREYTYLDVGEHMHWTMGSSLDKTILINRKPHGRKPRPPR